MTGDASWTDISEMKCSAIASRHPSDNSEGSSHDERQTLSRLTGMSGNANFSRLHGRDEEITIMKRCFMDVASDGAARLLLVAGVSGSGKSSLVEQMRNFVTSSACHGFFCEGKFEQSLVGGGMATNEPFSALITAFGDVIDFILNQGDTLLVRSQAIVKALGSDVHVLIDTVPNLSLLLGAARAQSSDISAYRYLNPTTSREQSSSKTSMHLAILYRNFLRSLTSEEAPILLFLDDLQFADEDSLDVFRALVTDTTLKHVLIVGAYRSNETSAAQLLNSNGGSNNSNSTISTTFIQVGDLDLCAINVGLSEILGLDEKTTETLSRVVLQKSGGNPFYVTQYLTLLREKQLLVYIESEDQWAWDVEKILMMTNVSNNVLQLVSQRLQALPHEVRALLTLIAFVGFRFEIELVERILGQLSSMDFTNSEPLENQGIIDKAVSLLRECKSPGDNVTMVQDALERAVQDGLVEKCSGSVFKFTHDRIQQGLYEMVKAESARGELHYYIGRAVSSLEFVSVEDKRSNLFFVADQLNRGTSYMTEEAELIELGETNLIVGKAAASQAAYQSAATYLRSAMNLLADAKYWGTHYSLMIDLCTSKAEIEAKVSNFERSRELCELVLQRGLTLDDKVRSYVCLVSSYCTQDLIDDAVTAGMEFLSQVGVQLPRRPTVAHVVINLIQTKKCMHKVSDSMILESPVMSDYKMENAMEVLNILATAYYMMANANEMFVIIVMRMVQLTRRSGLTDTSARGFAIYAVLNSSLGDRAQALRYGNLALALMESQDNELVTASVLTLVHLFVMWRETLLQNSAEPLIQGMKIGKQHGDLRWAYLSGSGAIGSMFYGGYHLHETLNVARQLCCEMIEYEVHSAANVTLPLWQIVENLIGLSDNTYELTGNAMDEDDMIQAAKDNKNLLALEVINSTRLCAAVIFQRWDLALEIAPLVMQGIKFFEAHFLGFMVRFYLGLTYAERHLHYGKRKDLRQLLKIIRKLKQWNDAGIVNCKPLYFILQAELAATRPKAMVTQREAAKAKYEKAIEECFMHNLIHFVGITSERALRFCQLHQDTQGAVKFKTDAENSYRAWGADAKVAQMAELYFNISNIL